MKKKVYILGGGFGGLYSALELERRLGKESNIDITLVNRENFFLFTPMLHEVAASDLELTTIVNPMRKLLSKVQLFAGEVEHIDLPNRRLTLAHGFKRHSHIRFPMISSSSRWVRSRISTTYPGWRNVRSR